MRSYCIFCETNKCAAFASLAEKLLDCRAMYPKQIQHTFSKGIAADIEHDLTPGYVFLFSKEHSSPPDMALARNIPGFIRSLKGSDDSLELAGDDERFAMMLFENGGVIGKTKVFSEGDRIRLTDSAFSGLEAEILKVNRRNQRMQIEIPFANSKIKTWVEYEIVDSAANT